MNIAGLLNSPYGQFVTGIFRGSENRENLKVHCRPSFEELDHILKNGIEVNLPNGITETFNVVVFFIADLGMVKEIIGKCSTTGTYGCYQCTKKINEWHSKVYKLAKPQSVKDFKQIGEEAEKVLGKNPNRDTKTFKSFQQNHYGQWVK